MEQERPTEVPKPSAPHVSTEATECTAAEQPARRVPARYNLYARLNVSLRTMDIIITLIVIAIAAALIIGIFCK